jgi:ATP-dependent DNA helicase 2 subunit 2
VPKRIAKARKDGHVHAHDEDDNLLLLDRKKASEKSFIHVAEASSSSSKTKTIVNAEDSETEDDDKDLLPNKPSTPLPLPKNVALLPTPARSLSPQVDPGRAPNRIIGTTYPLKDFKKNIAQGVVVTKAVEDLSAVITEIVMRPFASSRRKSELLECMTALRKTSLEVF